MRRLATFGLVVLAFGACAHILGVRPPSRRPFEHRKHVLSGIHCNRCHVGIARAGETGPLHIPGTDKCMECHEEPHDTGSCDGCHGLPEARQGAALARKHLRFQHKTHVPRMHGNCVRCHVDIRRTDEAIRPAMGACLGCHEHEDQFAMRDCAGCHVDLTTEDVRPGTHLVHDGDWAREHGVRAAGARDLCESCHAESFCASCHGATAPLPREQLAFDDPMTPGVHRAGFRSRHPEVARGNPGLCTTCHSAEACMDCHEDRTRAADGIAGGSPHGPGWLGPGGHGRSARRDPLECASCHTGAGEALCVRCHEADGEGGNVNVHRRGWSSELGKSAPACLPCHPEGT